jgi:hypothetical protein
LRAILSVGTPRGLQGRGGRAVAALQCLIHIVHGTTYGQSRRLVLNSVVAPFELLVFASSFVDTEIAICATGC